MKSNVTLLVKKILIFKKFVRNASDWGNAGAEAGVGEGGKKSFIVKHSKTEVQFGYMEFFTSNNFLVY